MFTTLQQISLYIEFERSDLTWLFLGSCFRILTFACFLCFSSIINTRREPISRSGKFPVLVLGEWVQQTPTQHRCSHNPSVGRFRRIYHPHSLDRVVLCLNTRYLLNLTYQRGSFLYPSTETICPNYLLYMLPTHALEFRL